MQIALLFICLLALACGLRSEAPVYSAAGLVNAADNQVGSLAPNTIATLYGRFLARGTKALSPDDVRGGVLPTVLPGTGVRVLVGGLPANMYYVSPGQINFLVPPVLLPGKVNLQLVIDGLAGPSVPVELPPASPALFQLDLENAVATRPDGSVVTPESPARPGDIVILYATGLGQTTPPIVYNQLPASAAWLRQKADFLLTLDGTRLAADCILYAGIAPGFAGLYQINVALPDWTGQNPEIRIGLGDALSMPGLRLPVQP
jgi:uncharacterized protein (TIGR03437 family)